MLVQCDNQTSSQFHAGFLGRQSALQHSLEFSQSNRKSKMITDFSIDAIMGYTIVARSSSTGIEELSNFRHHNHNHHHHNHNHNHNHHHLHHHHQQAIDLSCNCSHGNDEIDVVDVTAIDDSVSNLSSVECKISNINLGANLNDSSERPPKSTSCSEIDQDDGHRPSSVKLNTSPTGGCKRPRPKKFKCPYCWVALSNSGQFRGHLRIHTGERPFKCDLPFCGKTFTRNEELTRHRRIHTGQRPYPCSLCNKRFGRKDHLKKHMKTHEKHGQKMPHLLQTDLYNSIKAQHPIDQTYDT